MADETKSLDVLIRTSGNSQAKKELEELRKQLADLKGEVGNLKGANNDLQQAEQEGGKETEKFGLKKQELKKIVRELSHEFPLAGMAARAWLNPVGVAATVAIGLFVTVKEKIAEMNKEMDEMASRAATPIGDMAGKMREATAAASSSVQEFRRHLKELTDQEQSLLDKTNAVVDSIKKQETAFLELTDAREALAVELVNTQEELGNITSIQAIKERKAIKERFDTQRRQVKDDAEQAEIDTKDAALKRAQGQTPSLLAAAEAARAASTDPKRVAVLKDSPDRIKALEENAKKYGEAAAKATEARDKAEAQLASETNSVFPKDNSRFERFQKDFEQKKEEADRLVQIRDANQRALDRTRTELPRRQEEQAKLDAEAAGAKKKLDENTAAISTLTIELKALREDAQRNKALRDAVGGLHTQQRALSTSGEVVQAEQEEEKKKHTAERAAMKERAGTVAQGVKDGMEGAVTNTDEILVYLEQFVPGITAEVKAQRQRIEQLERTQDTFDQRQRAARNH